MKIMFRAISARTQAQRMESHQSLDLVSALYAYVAHGICKSFMLSEDNTRSELMEEGTRGTCFDSHRKGSTAK